MSEKKISLNRIPLQVLVINGSNRKKSNSAKLVEHAVKELEKYENVEVDVLEFYNKNYGRYDGSKDTDELIRLWKAADTVLWFLPNYTIGGPGTVYAAFERLSEAFGDDIRNGIYEKTAGVLVQGSSQYGMAELAMESTFEQLVSLHTIPIYRLPAHIPDQTGPTTELLKQVEQMVYETITGARVFKQAVSEEPDKHARVLVINAGVEDPAIGEAIEQRIVEKLKGTEGIHAEVFRFAKEPLRDCHHCNALCGKKFRCAFDDGFQDFFDKWLRSDGIIWIISANQAGVPAEIHNVHDRLSETGFSTVSDRARKLGVPYRFSRYTKPESAIAYGKYGYGGQTLAQQFVVNVAEQRGNYYISGRTPASLGPAALIRQKSQLGCDGFFTQAVDHLTEDVARIARGIQTAKDSLYEELPELFFNSRVKMGIPDKEEYFNE